MSERKCHILKDPEGCGCKCIDSLRAHVAQLEAGLIEAEDRIATALVGGICEQCVEVALAGIRTVLAKGRAA